jgi:branched-chain amino acid transport system ATP-binding protein
MAAPLLQTCDLSVHFGGVKAVKKVNFTLAEGELRCLIGPNGAGKSTFFKMLTGQLEPSHGKALFRGHDISRAHAYQIARLGIGIKTQVPNVFDGLSVRDNIWLAASRVHSGDRARRLVDEMMERLGLTHVADRVVGQLAHGQRQWVELGLVLSTDPELILLDEPAAGIGGKLERAGSRALRPRASALLLRKARNQGCNASCGLGPDSFGQPRGGNT